MIPDPTEHSETYRKYFSERLAGQVEILNAAALDESSRAAPWRFDLLVDGKPRSIVLRIDAKTSEKEYQILKAVSKFPIPTPDVYGLDREGRILGQPCFFMDFIEGEPLLDGLLAGDVTAEDLYIDAVMRLISPPEELLAALPEWLEQESARDVLESARQKLKHQSDDLVEQVYLKLQADMPDLPPVRFSNGDLYPANFLVKDEELVAVIDFANASYSDPVFEFLLAFFIHPELRGRGIEERFCRLVGIDPAVLPWYHVLEFYDLWGYLAGTEDTFAGYDAENIRKILAKWNRTGEFIR